MTTPAERMYLSKLEAIRSLIVDTPDDVDVTTEVLEVIDSPVWDGYQVMQAGA